MESGSGRMGQGEEGRRHRGQYMTGKEEAGG